MKGVPMTERH